MMLHRAGWLSLGQQKAQSLKSGFGHLALWCPKWENVEADANEDSFALLWVRRGSGARAKEGNASPLQPLIPALDLHPSGWGTRG